MSEKLDFELEEKEHPVCGNYFLINKWMPSGTSEIVDFMLPKLKAACQAIDSLSEKMNGGYFHIESMRQMRKNLSELNSLPEWISKVSSNVFELHEEVEALKKEIEELKNANQQQK